jgi:hypothetical protein
MKKFYAVLLGSSNLSDRGMQENIEFNCLLNLSYSDSNLKVILSSIKDIETKSLPISNTWLSKYTKKCELLRKHTNNLEKKSKMIKGELKSISQDKLFKWEKLVKEATKFKKTDEYQDRKKEIPDKVSECKKAIGSIKNPKVNTEKWKRKEVGYFSNFDSRQYKKTIPNTQKKLLKLNSALKYLLNEKVSIDERINNIVLPYGKYHISGMGIALASDILNKYYPEKYIIVNNPIIKALKHYGSRDLPSNPGEQYEVILSIYKKLRKEAYYPQKNGFALLDRFMWEIGHDILY